jgi:hypothetical protein
MVRDKLEERGRWEDSGSAKRVRDGRCSATQTQDSTVQSPSIWKMKRDMAIEKEQMNGKGSDQREDHGKTSKEMALTAKACSWGR